MANGNTPKKAPCTICGQSKDYAFADDDLVYKRNWNQRVKGKDGESDTHVTIDRPFPKPICAHCMARIHEQFKRDNPDETLYVLESKYDDKAGENRTEVRVLEKDGHFVSIGKRDLSDGLDGKEFACVQTYNYSRRQADEQAQQNINAAMKEMEKRLNAKVASLSAMVQSDDEEEESA